jgi:uncharacterized membrane protein
MGGALEMLDDMASGATTPLTQRIRRVPLDQPWRWIDAGWRDLMRAKAIGWSYGMALALAGWCLALTLFEAGTLWAVLPATSGFFLLAPLLATGLYETSRILEQGGSPTLADAFGGFRRNAGQVAIIGVVLLILHLFWVRMAGLVFMLCFGLNFAPSLEALPMRMLRSDMLLPFLVIGTGIGFVLASVSFAITVVSVPMLVDRQVSALEAISVSVQAAISNWRAMALWAGLIVLFTGLALVPFFLGLVLALPVVGHATWHAYRDLVAS